MSHNDVHDEFGGLHRDLLATGARIDRRELLRLGAKLGLSFGALQLLGCGGDSSGPKDLCARIPDEIGEGSSSPEVLKLTGIVRSDIRSSFAGLTGTAVGVPLTIQLTLISRSTCAPLPSRAVYVWHVDAFNRYSLYSGGLLDQNYLRGVQESDATGKVTFTSIFPGCYATRWPHIHFEVYPSLAMATDAKNKITNSQMAMPKEVCDQVYATPNYEQSIVNISKLSLATDSVFKDSLDLELATITGSVDTGLTASLTAAIKE